MMHTTSEPHTCEEAANLLEQQRAAADAARPTPQRRQVLWMLVGIVGTVALFTGAVVVVQMDTNSGDAAVSTANVNAAQHAVALNMRDGVQPTALEARFGWGSFKSGWCSIRANTGCLFSGDREKCKKEIHDLCDPKPEVSPSHGSGSSSGSGSGDDDGNGSGSGKRHKHPTRELRLGFLDAGIPT